MAMTLRLSDDETEALRAQAEKEHRSMQEVARAAVRDYVDRADHRSRVASASEEGAKRYSELLRRLGE